MFSRQTCVNGPLIRASSLVSQCPVPHPTRDFDPMLFQCWAIVAGQTLKQHWVNDALIRSMTFLKLRASHGAGIHQTLTRWELMPGRRRKQWANVSPALV